VRVFCAFAPTDADLEARFEMHLALLKREGYITVWHSLAVEAGAEKNRVMSEHLESAELILLLISADFMDSDECYDVVMRRALERQCAGNVLVVPVLLRPVDWKRLAPFAHLQVLPRNEQPVSAWECVDQAFYSIVQELHGIIESLRLPTSSFLATGNSDRIWFVSYQRNPYYTGQESLLAQLHASLQQHSGAALALSGLGGVGKTQLAVEYAYRYRDAYSTVLWANADSPETLTLSYRALAEALQLPPGRQAQLHLIVQAVRGWLTNHEGWLLVLDNADFLALPEQATLARTLTDFLPVEHKGHVLITTRASTLGPLAASLPVAQLSIEEGALFLLQRAHRLSLHAELSDAEPSERTVAEEFVQLVDALPLALDQAGAYIDEVQCSVADYVERYRTQRKYLLQRRGRYAIDHPEPVATTWTLALHRIEQSNPHAIALLNCCAFLQPDAIPEELFTQGAQEMGAALQDLAGNLLAFDEAIEALYAYSLVRRDPATKTFSLHRLVRDVVRDGLDEEQQREWLECVIRGLNVVFPDPPDIASWPVCQRFVLHVEAVFEFFEVSPFVSQEAAVLFSRAGGYLRDQAHFASAEGLFKRSLDLLEQVYGSSHTAVAQGLENLSDLYVEVGKCKDAERLLKRALAINEQAYGPIHEEVARTLNELAAIYRMQQRYRLAETKLKLALGINERVFGVDHPKVATSLTNLAKVLQDQEKYKQAEKNFLRAFAMRKRNLGSGHPDIANSLTNLGMLYQELGQSQGAEDYLQQAYSVRKSSLGEDHPDTIRSIFNLAIYYAEQGKYERAEELLLLALSRREKVLGTYHPDVAYTLASIGGIYSDLGKYDQARAFYLRAILVLEQMLGPEHIDLARVLTHYAEVLRLTGFSQQAMELEARARDIFTRMEEK
jgi:tetratricopeptide (TPR) repeat protein